MAKVVIGLFLFLIEFFFSRTVVRGTCLIQSSLLENFRKKSSMNGFDHCHFYFLLRLSYLGFFNILSTKRHWCETSFPFVPTPHFSHPLQNCDPTGPRHFSAFTRKATRTTTVIDVRVVSSNHHAPTQLEETIRKLRLDASPAQRVFLA